MRAHTAYDSTKAQINWAQLEIRHIVLRGSDTKEMTKLSFAWQKAQGSWLP